MRLAVLIPYFNKAHALDRLWSQITELERTLRTDFETIEWIFVDDGSENAEFVALETRLRAHAERPFRLLRHPVNRGKGAALVTAAKATSADTVLWLDADGAFSVRDVTAVAAAARTHPQAIVVADRRQSANSGQTGLRRVASGAFRALARMVLRLPVRDLQAGLKAMPGEWFRSRAWRNERFALDVELLREARREGRKILSVPVHDVVYEGRSSVRLGLASFDLVRELLGPLVRPAFLGGFALIILGNLRAFSLRSGVTWDARDEMFFYFRWLGSALREGVWAEFNPHVGAGYPVGANPQSGTYNPLYLFFAWAFPDSILSVNLLYLTLQVALFGAGFLLFFELGFLEVTSVVSALALVASGFVTSHASHFSYVSSALAWTVAFAGLAFLRRGHAGLGVLAVALGVAHLCTAGYPAIWVFGAQVFVIVGLAMLFFGVERGARLKFAVRAVGGGLAGVGLGLPALLHFVGQLKLSARAGGLPVDQVLQGSLPAAAWWNLLVPYLPMGQVPGGVDVTMMRFHALGVTVPLALLGALAVPKLSGHARTLWSLTLAAFVVCTVLAFGDHSGLGWRRWLAEHVFLYRAGRFPSGEHSYFATLFCVGLAAVGGERVWRRWRGSRRGRRAVAAIVALDFLAILFVTMPVRYMQLPQDLQGHLARFKVFYGAGDERELNAPRGCPFDPNAEFDQRLTPPNRFSWDAYANLQPAAYVNERENLRWALCGPSRLWAWDERQPWPYELSVYAPHRIEWTAAVPASKKLLWADVDDGRWRLFVNGEPREMPPGPARLRVIDLSQFTAGERVRIEMSYRGPLTRLWRR